MMQDVLRIQASVHSLEHPRAADTQNNIGVVFQRQGKYPEALEMYEKVLKTRVAVLGPEHPHVADTKNKCAAFFFPMACVDH